MKDELAEKAKSWDSFETAKRDIDDWIDYYNTERPQWQLNKLTPDQYYTYTLTGIYVPYSYIIRLSIGLQFILLE